MPDSLGRASVWSPLRGIARWAWLAATALALAACTATTGDVSESPKTGGEAPLRFLAFGDSGYSYEFLAAKELAHPVDAATFLADERQDWIDDKRPIAEFELPPMHVLPSGGVTAASGLFPVANAMRGWCARPPACEFAVMLGDNIYPKGASGNAESDSPRWRRLFAEPFGELFGARPRARIYSVLGNHDWYTSREGALAQARYLQRTPPFYMDGFIYRVVPPASGGAVEIFAIDTHVLLSGVEVPEDALADDGSERESRERETTQPWVVPQTDAERSMVQWLEAALKDSRARWKIVIGHHPLWSSSGSKFQQARAMRRLLLPALCRYADLYLAGHEHTLEAHSDSCAEVPGALAAPLPQIVSGAAAKQRGLNSAFAAHQLTANPQLETLWARGMLWGFAEITVTGDRAQVRLVETPDSGDGESQVVFEHEFQRRTRAARAGNPE